MVAGKNILLIHGFSGLFEELFNFELGHFIELTSLFTGLLDNRLRFFLPGNPFALKPLLFGAGLLSQSGDFLAHAVGFDSALFNRTDQFFKAQAFIRKQPCSLVNNLTGKAEAAGNSKCITDTGHTDQQAVGRAQSLTVEFTAGVFHAWCVQGIALEFLIMGGRHRPAAMVAQIIKDRDRQGSAF